MDIIGKTELRVELGLNLWRTYCPMLLEACEP